MARQIWEGYVNEANPILAAQDASSAVCATNLSLAAPSSAGILQEEEKHLDEQHLDDILPDGLISEILKKLACREARSLGLACCACKAFKRVLLTEGSTLHAGKQPFSGSLLTLKKNVSVCEMEQALVIE
jgi:hypothetical protein